MNCHELTDLLLDYLNNELPDDFIASIRTHLKECPPCVIYVETYEITIKLGRKLCPPTIPEGLARRLQAALQQHLHPQEKKADG